MIVIINIHYGCIWHGLGKKAAHPSYFDNPTGISKLFVDFILFLTFLKNMYILNMWFCIKILK